MGTGPYNAENSDGDARRFAAFISYSHADAYAAAKLQRKLERYRLPGRIAKTRDRPPALGAIFRDREDLAAAANLSDAIRDAIRRTEVLIVICSPGAAASPWVAAEIDLFRSLHPDRPILAVLLSGEPATSFPAALTEDGLEPLAADLRPDGDGAQLGFLKIVAGIAGVPLDALIQRDAQRRIRRVMAITVGALAAMLIMAVMTTLALSARNEAARQRAEAEGLVEYMLTDLREKLKGVGRLAIMDAVNERAMAYYADQGDIGLLPADSIERRARILHAMGEDNEKAGNLDKALERFREAHQATETLLKKEPVNADRLFAHAKSEYWLGFSKQKRAEFGPAIAAYNRYLLLSQQAVQNGLDPTVGQREQGWAHNAIGVVLFQNIGDNKQALNHFLSYRNVFKTLLKATPKNTEVLYNLADAYAWLAEVQLAVSALDEASDNRRLQLSILDRLLLIDPKNDQWLWSKIAAERSVFRICYKLDDVGCARQSLANATKLLAARDFDPTNRDWIWQSAYVSLDRGFLEAKLGNMKGAAQALAEGSASARRYGEASQGDQAAIGELDKTMEALADKLN